MYRCVFRCILAVTIALTGKHTIADTVNFNNPSAPYTGDITIGKDTSSINAATFDCAISDPEKAEYWQNRYNQTIDEQRKNGSRSVEPPLPFPLPSLTD